MTTAIEIKQPVRLSFAPMTGLFLFSKKSATKRIGIQARKTYLRMLSAPLSAIENPWPAAIAQMLSTSPSRMPMKLRPIIGTSSFEPP